MWAESPLSEQHAPIGSALRLGHQNSVRHLVVPPDEPSRELSHEPSHEASDEPFSKVQKRLQVRVHEGWGPTSPF